MCDPRAPDFLVISPPKTGSTWLAENLRRHPGLFVPAAKELKYFSSQFKWLDHDWYLEQFASGLGRVKGEASPSYASLPVERIQWVRRRFPGVKLIFLMRDPVARAWSHARHNHRYREANFADAGPDFAAVPAADWRANFAHDWPATSGDYLGQLRRWRSVFPREQLFVGFYESIAARPAELLRDVFSFLGVDPGVDLSGFPLTDRILPGPAGELSPDLRESLRAMLHDRTRELAVFLRSNFWLEPPPEWADTLTVPAQARHAPLRAFAHEADDEYLGAVLAQEETFPTGPAEVFADYLGYDAVLDRGRLTAVARTCGPAHLVATDEAAVRRHEANGDCIGAPDLAALRERVARVVAERAQRRVAALETGLGEATERIARLEAKLTEVAGEVGRLNANVVRIPPHVRSLHAAVRRVGRRLRRLAGSVRHTLISRTAEAGCRTSATSD